MKKSITLGFAAVAVACLGVSCDSATKVSSLNEVQAAWTLSTINAESVVENGATVIFEGGRIGGNLGCNQFGGDVTLENDSLHIGNLIGTRKMCPDMSFEQSTQGLLNSSAWSLSIKDETLTMQNADNTIELTKVATETAAE